MKIRYQSLLATSLTWIFFILVASCMLQPLLDSLSLVYFILFSLFCGICSFIITDLLITKRLIKLSRYLSQNKLQNHVDVEGHDELSTLAMHINRMADTLHSAEEKIIHQWEEREKFSLALTEKDLVISKSHLSQLAHYDHLTALPNRIYFNEMLNKTLSHAARYNKSLAILFIDLDHFKNIYNALGKKTSDLVLKTIADRFSSTLRSSDILARLGGDEFIVLLNDIEHPKFAAPVAKNLLEACAKPVNINGRDISITASIGICIYPNDGVSLQDLQKNAELALYKAKHLGGNVYQYFSHEMTLAAHKHIQLDTALKKAIENNEFVLHYQPKLNLSNGTIAGVEALIRWANPEVGLIRPSNFIPQTEEMGFISKIGEWALHEACRACKSWQNQGYSPISVAVNLSIQQFHNKNLVQQIEKILTDTGLDPRYLELEITETMIIDDIKDAIETLKQLKDMGVKIAIDDFGTGYSSISYLKQFPIDILKIDLSFIKDIPSNQNDVAITNAIISLGHNLGLQVIAEGVETAAQLDFLAEHHCDYVQGYYFCRPLPEQKLLLQLL